MMKSSNVLSIVAALLIVADPAAYVSANVPTYCNSCKFNVTPAEERNCTVYGLLGDEIIPWKRAPVNCLNNLQIGVRNQTYEAMLEMCPNRDGTNATELLISNMFRENTYISTDLKQNTTVGRRFFEDQNGTYGIKETIETRTGEILNCTEQESFCWQSVLIYLSQGETAPEDIAKICNFVHDTENYNSELEQSLARELLCNGTSTSSNCRELLTQINEYKNASAGVEQCPAFGVPAPPPQYTEDNLGDECIVPEASNSGRTRGIGWVYGVTTITVSWIAMMLSTMTSVL